jgi:aminodeoxyfutalosine deaminase
VFPDLASHAIGPLVEAGAVVTVNTDDPHMFGTTLIDEYRRVAGTFGLDVSAVARLVADGIRSSFLDDGAKRRLLAEVAATAADHGATLAPR